MKDILISKSVAKAVVAGLRLRMAETEEKYSREYTEMSLLANHLESLKLSDDQFKLIKLTNYQYNLYQKAKKDE